MITVANLLAFSASWLSDGFSWLLRATWQAAILALLVAAAQWLLGRRLSARARCLLWSVVVARLLLPPLPGWRPAIFPMLHASAAPALPVLAIHPSPVPSMPARSIGGHVDEKRVAELRAQLAAMPDDTLDSPLDTAGREAAAPHLAIVQPVKPVIRFNYLRMVRLTVPWVWLLGTLILSVRIVWASLRLRRTIRRLPPLDDPGVLRLLDSCAAEIGLPHPPVALVADHLSGPALAGYWKPRLLVPRQVCDVFPASELRLMLLHELAHVRRRDVLVSWLLGGLQALHWFNPVIVLALRRMRADRELACDEMVLAATSPQERRAYGYTLLRLAENLSNRSFPRALLPATAGLVSILDDKRHLQRRIVMICCFNPAVRSWPALCAGGLLLLAGVALTDAAEPAKKPAPPSQDVRARGVAFGDFGVAFGDVNSDGSGDVILAGAGDTASGTAASDDDSLKVAELRYVASKAALDAAQSKLKRAQALVQDGVESVESVEQARAEVAKLEADFAQAKLQADQIKRQISDAKAKRSFDSVHGSAAGLPFDTGNASVDVAFSIKAAELNVHARQAELQVARAKMNRFKELVASGAAPFVEVEQAKAEIAKAEAELAQAELEAQRVKSWVKDLQNHQPQLHPGKQGSSGGSAMGPGMGSAMGIGAGSISGHGDEAVVQDAEAQRLDAQTAQRLRKPMSVQHLSGPVSQAVQYVRETTGVDIIIDRDAQADQLMVNDLLVAQPAPAGQVLTWMLRAASGEHLGYAIDHGAVLIATRDRLDRMTVTRVYDVSDLSGEKNLTELIREIIAPQSWREVGGNGVARMFGQKLLVTQTEPTHAQLEKLLSLLRGKAGAKPEAGMMGGGSFGGGEGFAGGAKGEGPMTGSGNFGGGAPNAAGAKAEGPMSFSGGTAIAAGAGGKGGDMFALVFTGPREKAKLTNSANHARQLLVAVHMYAQDHKNFLPEQFPDDLKPYLDGKDQEILANPRVPDKKIGYVYVRPASSLTDIRDTASTVMLYEATDQWGEGVCVGFADGHVEIVKDRDEFLKRLHMTPREGGDILRAMPAKP